MIPFGDHIVTLYHRERIEVDGRAGEAWSRHILTGCSWRDRVVSYTTSTEVLRNAETVCRVPPGQQKPSVGDVMVKGETAEIAAGAADAARILERYTPAGAFRVTSIADNTSAPLPHFAARGS